tara:strand:- start:292 stop:495 length:204 start_codon:yes stop_codon:yes gene_type:complete
MSNPKNAYELRTDLLGMAIGILESRNARFFENECLKPEGQRQAINPYATEDVLIVAEKLRQFVQTKD